MPNICICGGGSLAHVCAGVLSSHQDVCVNILTRKPECWSHNIDITDIDGSIYHGNLNIISSQPEEALHDCDIVFLCLPGFAIESTLRNIKPYIQDTIIGSVVSSTGFFFAAHKELGNSTKLFGFQRVPYIARTTEYGHKASLLGHKNQLAVATENIENREAFKRMVEYLWMTPTKMLDSFYEASLTNSNPILHTGRLYSMWKDWKGEVYDHNILFYKEWTKDASQLLIDMDAEFMKLIDALHLNESSIPSLLDYYESTDAESLTNKIQSIPAFQNITSPMKEVDGGWIPDFSSRYFTEDFPYGLRFIVELARENHISTPVIDKVFEWGHKMTDKR